MEFDAPKEPWGLNKGDHLIDKADSWGETVGITVAQHGALAPTEPQHEVTKDRFLEATASG